jgi:transposase
MCRSALAELMRIDWHTVGGICARVEASLEGAAGRGRLDGLRRIGVDETSYKKGHKYMTVVVDHDSGRGVWAAKGHGKAQLDAFFDLLDDGQRSSIEVVTADGARWIADVVAARLPGAVLAVDPFHAVSWATAALDDLRRQTWREARGEPRAKRGRGRPAAGPGRAPPSSTAGSPGRAAAAYRSSSSCRARCAGSATAYSRRSSSAPRCARVEAVNNKIKVAIRQDLRLREHRQPHSAGDAQVL